MNKLTVRIIAMLMVLLMTIACFAACSDPVETPNEEETQGDGVADVTDEQGSETEAPEQPVEEILGFEIPELNKQFNIIYMKNMPKTVSDIIADSFDGDEVSVEVYERNLNIEESFQVKLNFIDSLGNWDTRSEDKRFMETAVQSGANDYDMMAGSNVASATMMYSGLFFNLCELDPINFDHSWWMNDIVGTYGIGEHVYGMMGEATHSFYSEITLMIVNTTLAENFGVQATHGDLYEMVYSGKWTLDKMLEIGGMYGEDNGDGNMILGDDVIGMVATSVPSRNFLYSLGLELITLNDTADGVVIPAALDEKTINSYEKLYAAFPQSGVGSSANYASADYANTEFSEDKVLMMNGYFSNLGTEQIRNMTSEYMIMPMPKYDEAQSDYVSPFGTTASMLLIPLTAAEPENTAMIIEYMGYLGEKNICPVYVEQTLKLKYATDPKVMEMVQFIIDRAAFTLTQAMIWNCEAGANFRNMYAFGELNTVGSPNVASFYSSYRRVWQKQLDNICKGLE